MTGSHPKLTVQPAPRTKPAKLLRLGVLIDCPEARDHTSGSTHQGIIVMGQPAYRKALLLCLAAATEATKVSERKWKAAADEALAAFKPIRKSVNSCVEIKIRRVRPESSRRWRGGRTRRNLICTQLLTDLRMGLKAARASSAAAFHLRSDTFVAPVAATRQRSSAFR